MLVVAPPPHPHLVASSRGAVEPLIHAPEAVQSACISGVGVVEDAVLESECAHARPLADIGGHVGASHDRVLSDGTLAAILRVPAPLSRLLPFERAVISRRLAVVVVFNAALALLLLGERDVEIEVEIAAEG